MNVEELVALVWTDEPPPKDEGRKTVGGEGWLSWNGKAPEWEFCEFAGSLVRLLRPGSIIESGMGAGFVTRRLVENMDPGFMRLACFESDPEFRAAGRDHAWRAVEVRDEPTPTELDIANADLLVLDSASPWREREFRSWAELGRPGSYCLMHDVDPTRGRGTVQLAMAELIATVGVPGILLANPRGGWLGRKP